MAVIIDLHSADQRDILIRHLTNKLRVEAYKLKTNLAIAQVQSGEITEGNIIVSDQINGAGTNAQIAKDNGVSYVFVEREDDNYKIPAATKIVKAAKNEQGQKIFEEVENLLREKGIID